MLQLLGAATGKEIIGLAVIGLLLTNMATGLYFYNLGEEHEETRCELEKNEAENSARKNADKVTDVSGQILEDFEVNRNVAFQAITKSDLDALARNAKLVGEAQGYLKGQKDAFNEAKQQIGSCLNVKYDTTDRLFLTAEELRSDIFSSGETSSVGMSGNRR